VDNVVLKKKLSTFRTPKGKLTRVSDDVLLEVLQSWEQWPGTSTDMAKDLGLTMRQLVILVEKGKKLLRNGGYAMSDFKEIKVEALTATSGGLPCTIEIIWNNNQLIRFAQVDQLVDFLKKVA
jgi:hypothetical protein